MSKVNQQQDGVIIHNDDYSDWHEADKAAWILANGPVVTADIFERVDDVVYVRKIAPDGKPLPPWISKERTVYKRRKKNDEV